MVGTQFGPYGLDRVLGRGGMGEVYLAYDTGHRREVAIKLLLESLSADPGYRARFEREARIAAGLREQHIIPIHRYGEIDDRLYIDMRLVDGEDLAKLLQRGGPLAPQRAVRIAAQVAAALDAAHGAGLIHRDIKPGNVLIADPAGGGGDSVYLADFGIARESAADAVARLTLTGTALGTPDYMAPERFGDGVVDRAADIYALACLLHEMLTARKPFAGTEWAKLLYKHLNEPPPRASTIQDGVPPALDAVVARGMDKDPRRRYSSAGDLAAAAEAALAAGTPRRAVTADTASAGTLVTADTATAGTTASAGTPVTAGPAGSTAVPGPAPERRWPRWFYETDPAPAVPTPNVWPTATEYVRAVQAAPLSAAGLGDARLVRDPLGMPVSSSGQNAVVFEMGQEGRSGLALRCFTRSPDDAAARC